MTFADAGKHEQPIDGTLFGRPCTAIKTQHAEAEYTAQPPYGDRIDVCAEHITHLFGQTDAQGNDLVPRRIKAPPDAEPVTVADVDTGGESKPGRR